MRHQTTQSHQVTGSLLYRATMPLAMFVLACACILGVHLTSAASRDNNAHVRIVHASPKTGPVDIFVDGKKLLSGFSFGTVTDYATLTPGKHEIKIALAGKGEKAALITANANVKQHGYYTIAATGGKQGEFSVKGFKDDNTGNTKDARIRVYHLSPDLGTVNVTTSDNKKLVSDLHYEQASDYITVPAGSYTLNATATKTDKKLPIKADVKDGKVYSVFVFGELKGQPPLAYKVKSVDMQSATAQPGQTPTGTATKTATKSPTR